MNIHLKILSFGGVGGEFELVGEWVCAPLIGAAHFFSSSPFPSLPTFIF